MKKITIIAIVFLFIFVSCSKDDAQTLNVYAYDSFCSDWGPGKEIVEEFEKETSIKVNLVGCGSAVQLYSRLLLEKETSKADVIIGLSDSMNIDESIFYPWEPQCKKDLIHYNSNKLIPFNYGYYSFLVNEKYFNNKNSSNSIPSCLEDLLKPEFKNSFVLIDPRTSSVGLGLLEWTILSLGEEKALAWWKEACKNSLTVSDSWSNAYGIFTSGEAPFVLSYTTSPVYHRMYENDYSIKALEFLDGHIRTTEYLAIANNSKNKENAKKFCEYILTKGQEKIAISNTMFPSNEKTALPEEYLEILKPKELEKDSEFNSKKDYYLDRWTEILVK